MQKYECKTCGAELKWNPTAGALVCEYCGDSFQPTDFEDATTDEKAVENTSHVVDAEYANTQVNDGEVIYKCDECGAEIVALETTMSTECPYCGRPISITSSHKGKFRPEMVLPYSIEREAAIECLKKYLSSAILAPRRFKSDNVLENVKGLYIPFYLHTFHDASIAEYECEDITSKRRGDDKVSIHKVYSVSLTGDTDFNRIPVDGSTVIDDKTMYALEPFDFSNIKEYNPAYMAGYYADQPDETVESTKPTAIERGKSAIGMRCRELLSKYEKVVEKRSNHRITNHSAEYAMLPVWRLNIKFKDKIYQYNVNGQTGEVSGKIPMSIPKVAILSGCFSIIGFLIKFFGVI